MPDAICSGSLHFAGHSDAEVRAWIEETKYLDNKHRSDPALDWSDPALALEPLVRLSRKNLLMSRILPRTTVRPDLIYTLLALVKTSSMSRSVPMTFAASDGS